MVDIDVRSLDEAVADILEARAERNGRSLEDKVRAILTGSASAEREASAANG